MVKINIINQTANVLPKGATKLSNINLKLEGIESEEDLFSCEAALNSLPGVSAEIDYDSFTASVTYDEDRTTVEDIYAAIASAASAAEPSEEDGEDKWDKLPPKKPHFRPRKQFKRLRIAAAFLCAIALYVLRALELFKVEIPLLSGSPAALSLVEMLIFAAAAYAGSSLYIKGIASLLRLRPDTKTVAAAGTALAAGYSVYSAARVFLGDSSYRSGIYFAACALVIAMALLGIYLEEKSTAKADKPIKKLMELFPESATIIIDDAERQTDISDITPGDLVLVKPGESFPCDGVIEAGRASVVEAMFTGENMPVDKSVSDRVFAGTLNTMGFATVRVQRVGEDTSLARIIRSVSQISDSKKTVVGMTKRAEVIFCSVILAAGAIAFALWAAFGTVSEAVRVLIAVLTVCCPCSMGLAEPAAAMFACAKAAREGVVFKNIEALELAGSLNTVVMDKTGTVTVGKPFVTDVLPIGISAEELMILAASLEEHSAHPIASAVLDYAKKNEIYPIPCEDFRSEAGRGMSASVEGETVKLASVSEIFAGEYEGYAALSQPLSDEGKAVVALSRAGVPIGVIAFADKLKPTSRSAIEKLNAMGMRTIMLTGDTPEAAKKVAAELSFYDCAAGVSPDKKADIIGKLKYGSRKVAMVGDSTNDAAALAAADVGVAIGTGSAVALECAQIILVRNDLRDLADAIKISRRAVKAIKGNIFWALIFCAVMLPFAAGLLRAFGGPLLDPIFAGICMAVSGGAIFAFSCSLFRK